MARTIPESFLQFKKNLSITNIQQTTVSTRQTNIRSVVQNDLKVIDSFLTGSYSRDTMIAPLNEADIDIFLILDSSYYSQGGQSNLLDRLKRALLKTYTKTPKISRNGQAVTITFTDFVVDVIPAFNRQGGGYLIPDTHTDTWLETNPKIHVKYISDANSAHNGDLVPLIKMIKRWNKYINHAFVSFYLELITVDILNNVKITDFPSGMRYFFDKGRETIKYKAIDPVSYGCQINGLDGVTVQEAISKFETAYNRAVKAEDYASKGQIQYAIDEWRKIFGNYFPAYG